MEFFKKYKKIFLIIIFLVTVFLLGYLLYYVFFKEDQTPVTVEPATTTTPGGLPTAGEGTGQITQPGGEQVLPGEERAQVTIPTSDVARGGLTKSNPLVEDPSLGATLDSNGKSLQYYNKNDGKFYRVTGDGDIEELSDRVFYNVENITWAPNKEKAILEYPDGANIVYNFETKKQVTLPSHWKDFDFSPNSDKIVTKSIGLDSSNRWLAISNDDGSNVKAIEPMGIYEDTVYPSWSPNNQTIAMYTKGVDFDRQEVFFVGLNNENFKSTIVHGRDFRFQWSPDGEKLLYSVYSSDNNMNPTLWMVDAKGEKIGSERKSLKIDTWADKCTFTSDTEIYCAVPEELPEMAGVFPELADQTKDRLYKIDTATGYKKLIAIPDGSYNISSLMVSNDEKTLYFTDKTNNQVRKVNLK